MKALVKLPIGIEFFQEIRTEGFYYVDKTGLIAILKYGIACRRQTCMVRMAADKD